MIVAVGKVTFEESHDFIDQLWDITMTQQELSFVAVSEDDPNEILGVMWGLDHHSHAQDPDINSPHIKDVIEFVLSVEGKHVKKLFGENSPSGTAYEPFYLATKRTLGNQDNLVVAKALEEENVRLAKALGYKVIVGMNTGPVTQHLALTNGYQRLETVPINSWVSSSGRRPFSDVSDDVVVTIDAFWL